MATVKGLCSSSIAPSTSTSRLSSSASRYNVHFNARAMLSRSSRKCRVVSAVLVDPKVQPASKSGVTIELEKSETPSVVDSRLLELVDSTDFQMSVQIAEAPLKAAKMKKATPTMGLTDTKLKSTLEHRLWCIFGGAAVTGMLAKAFLACQSPEDYLQIGVGAVAAWILSDLGTGIYHWGVDNYGDASTPIFGSQIDAFQGHHQRPWTITKREFANNIHALARPAGIFLAPFLLLPSNSLGDSFLALFLGLVVMSQQIHAFAHMKKSQLPESIIALQDSGVLLSRKMHGTHHKPPYDINYCIVSGLWNPLLNETEAFKRAERSIFSKWKVAPRAWSETSEEWLAMDTYFEDGTDFDPSQS